MNAALPSLPQRIYRAVHYGFTGTHSVLTWGETFACVGCWVVLPVCVALAFWLVVGAV
jgi:hypothetical protein